MVNYLLVMLTNKLLANNICLPTNICTDAHIKFFITAIYTPLNIADGEQ